MLTNQEIKDRLDAILLNTTSHALGPVKCNAIAVAAMELRDYFLSGGANYEFWYGIQQSMNARGTVGAFSGMSWADLIKALRKRCTDWLAQMGHGPGMGQDPNAEPPITLERMPPHDFKRRPKRIEIRGGRTIWREIKYD